jgi:hypothetical protein
MMEDTVTDRTYFSQRTALAGLSLLVGRHHRHGTVDYPDP